MATNTEAAHDARSNDDQRYLLLWKEATVEGTPASYGEAGDGAPIVFLHGWGLSHRAYKRPMSRLASTGMRVIAPALPGFGGTQRLPASARDLAGYSHWVAAFLDTIGVTESVILAGHSFGGGVAIQTAYDHPKLVRGLILMNSIGGSAWKERGGVVRAMTERPLWDWGLHFPADLWPLRQARRVLPVIASEVGTNLLRDPGAFWHTAAIARRANLTEALEDLKRRRLPVVVLWGSRDQVITQASFESMCRALGTPGVVTIDAPHVWLIADPDAFGEVMTNVVKVAEDAAAMTPSAPPGHSK